MIKVKINRDGVRELLKSNEIADVCLEYAERVQGIAGDGYVSEPRNYPERSGAAVRPDTDGAFYRNLYDGILERALGDVSD